MSEFQTSLKGQLLIAMPTMDDERFTQAVIFINEHNEEGASGFVLNKPSDKQVLKDILVKMPAEFVGSFAERLPVYTGGPVKSPTGHLVYVENKGVPRLVASTSLGLLSESIKKGLARAQMPPMRLLLGYTGWSAGQLENELQANVWLTAPCKANEILTIEPEKLYQHCIASFANGGLSAISQMGGLA